MVSKLTKLVRNFSVCACGIPVLVDDTFERCLYHGRGFLRECRLPIAKPQMTI